MKLALNLLVTFGLMVLVLLAVAPPGWRRHGRAGIWSALLVVAMVVVARRSRRQVSS